VRREITGRLTTVPGGPCITYRAPASSPGHGGGQLYTPRRLRSRRRGLPTPPPPSLGSPQEKCESFFNFFNPPKIPEAEDDIDEDEMEELQMTLEGDYDMGIHIRDTIIPNAVAFFTGEALEDDEDDEDDDDEGHDGGDSHDDGEPPPRRPLFPPPPSARTRSAPAQ